ncbi:MAG TPA: hypothetical protein PK029_02690 [Bacteroidales bacterium]|nr:MAG: hypothetical protein BWY22_01131 [Bacteroidetes bacterium ADurb.Bin217]HOS83983.1 hypothetical protein [Bacteroidales bacterium]HPH16052.1 hypothetical protein [Bacteroidales bacterium]HPM13023.1 hypothetical protein [Bacteroidales bacterium]
MQKINTFWFGLLCGLLLPPIALAVIYFFFTKTMTFSEFLSILKSWELGTNVFIWSVIPVFFLFSFFYYKKLDQASKGIVLPTMIYTIILVIMNF